MTGGKRDTISEACTTRDYNSRAATREPAARALLGFGNAAPATSPWRQRLGPGRGGEVARTVYFRRCRRATSGQGGCRRGICMGTRSVQESKHAPGKPVPPPDLRDPVVPPPPEPPHLFFVPRRASESPPTNGRSPTAGAHNTLTCRIIYHPAALRYEATAMGSSKQNRRLQRAHARAAAAAPI